MSYHLFVRYHELEDYLRMGWNPSNDLDGTHHGHWTVLCHWLCDCPMPVLQRVSR